MEMQKCLHLYDALAAKKSKIVGEYTISEKLDGWWVAIEHDVNTGWKTPISSSGRVIPSLDFINFNDLNIFTKLDRNAIILAEVTHPDYPIFADLNGKLNRKYEKCSGAVLNVHDLYFPYNMHLNAYSRLKLLDELLATAKTLFYESNEFSFSIKPIKSLAFSSNIDEWKKLFDAIVNAGGEGIVAKQLSGIYQPGKRNSSLIKMKEEITLDLLCTDLVHSFGKKGEPSLVMECVSSNNIKVNVVIPKDFDRLLFTQHPEEILNKVVEIKAMKKLKDSLREPRFKAIRHDKNKFEIDVI